MDDTNKRREPTEEEKKVLEPDFKSLFREKTSEAKTFFQKTETELRTLIKDLTDQPQKTIEESKEVVKNYVSWLQKKSDSLSSIVEKGVQHGVRSFASFSKQQDSVGDLETRINELQKQVDELKNKQPSNIPPESKEE